MSLLTFPPFQMCNTVAVAVLLKTSPWPPANHCEDKMHPSSCWRLKVVTIKLTAILQVIHDHREKCVLTLTENWCYLTCKMKEYTVLTQKPLIASAANRLLQCLLCMDDTWSALTNYSPGRSVTQIGNGDGELVKHNFYTPIFKHFLMILARNPSSW